MPYDGPPLGSLWVRSIYIGAIALAVGVSFITLPTWDPAWPPDATPDVLIFFEAAGGAFGVLGILLVRYGLRWRRTGFNDAAMVKLVGERIDRFRRGLRR
jgi:hypothetical protein